MLFTLGGTDRIEDFGNGGGVCFLGGVRFSCVFFFTNSFCLYFSSHTLSFTSPLNRYAGEPPPPLFFSFLLRGGGGADLNHISEIFNKIMVRLQWLFTRYSTGGVYC